MNKIKNILENNKKKLVVVVLLLLAIALSTGYILTNKKADVKPTSNKTSEVTTKEDNKSDKKTEVKTDKKSDEKKDEVKEDKKEDNKVETTVEETKTTNVENNTNSTPTENNNTTTNTTSNTVSNTAKPTSTPCVPTYTTVNHPEQGHYETQVVSQAWDEPVYDRKIVGLTTGRVYNSVDEFLSQDEDGNYTVKDVQVDTIHHEAVTQQVWVVDQQAWTETVASGC
jgi:hypothetical protein